MAFAKSKFAGLRESPKCQLATSVAGHPRFAEVPQPKITETIVLSDRAVQSEGRSIGPPRHLCPRMGPLVATPQAVTHRGFAATESSPPSSKRGRPAGRSISSLPTVGPIALSPCGPRGRLRAACCAAHRLPLVGPMQRCPSSRPGDYPRDRPSSNTGGFWLRHGGSGCNICVNGTPSCEMVIRVAISF